MRDESYLEFLCSLIGAADDPGYLLLAKDLHDIPFRWILDRDENRAEDGLLLRSDYDGMFNPSGSCSVLEMLIGLAQRVDFELDDCMGASIMEECFWSMIENLGLDICIDEEYGQTWNTEFVEERVNRFMDRTYDYSGYGGLFPLLNPTRDQREVEIWYQMSAYLREHEEEF